MSEFQITFVGICAHLWEDQPNALEPSDAFGKRIVLPNAGDATRIHGMNQFYGFNNPIQPHVAQLLVFEDQVESIEGPLQFTEGSTRVATLEGVTIRVNSVTGAIVKDARCLPGLGSFQPNVAPGLASTTNDPTLASAYFDFDAGTVTGVSLTQQEGAGAIIYTTETQGNAILTISPFGPVSFPTDVKFKPDITVLVTIQNLSFPETRDNNDFVLQYLAASALPPQWPAPTPPFPLLGIPCNPHPDPQKFPGGNDWEFGASCSNSNIP